VILGGFGATDDTAKNIEKKPVKVVTLKMLLF
jgi:hypothetical protein